MDLLGFLIQLVALDALYITAGSANALVVVGLQAVHHSGNGSLLLFCLPGHTEALRSCRRGWESLPDVSLSKGT